MLKIHSYRGGFFTFAIYHYMDSLQVKKVNQTLSFVSMTIAWALMNFLNAIYLAYVDGKADESGVVIFWSGLFMVVAWAIFIVFPLRRLDHSRQFFKPHILPFVSGLYGGMVYSIIVGGIFRSFELVMMFMPLAIVVGLLFGLSYSALIRLEKLTAFLVRRPYAKMVFFLSPAIILFCFLWLLPAIAPSLAFRYMPDKIRDSIVMRTIPRYKVGDKFQPLKEALPSYFDHIQNGSGNMAEYMENFSFVLQVHCNKIIRLEYAVDPKVIDMTIYGKLQDKPCP